MANEMRDRLVELYAKAKRNMWGRIFHSDLERNMYIADYLIANDVVSVVRCKDCEHSFFIKSCSKYECRKGCGALKFSNDYCSYGERRCSDESRIN
jgi:hypothetical protein